MIAIPAVDIRDGACVQLVGGSYEHERVRLDDPREVAQAWARTGFGCLHLVDLDAATARGSNTDVMRDILLDRTVTVQVGGGVRTVEQVEQLLSDGARRVVLGTKAIDDPAWLADAAADFPGRLIVAADVNGRQVVTRGWSRESGRDVLDVIHEITTLPLAGIMVTAVHVEGQMQGPDLHLIEDVVEVSLLPVHASGGVSSMDDLRALEDRGVAAAIIGMALYTGALDPRAVAEDFAI
ncbi:MAG: HisA/HisF-related TIM barrel protein [Gemmatimonadaceae bacterium]